VLVLVVFGEGSRGRHGPRPPDRERCCRYPLVPRLGRKAGDCASHHGSVAVDSGWISTGCGAPGDVFPRGPSERQRGTVGL